MYVYTNKVYCRMLNLYKFNKVTYYHFIRQKRRQTALSVGICLEMWYNIHETAILSKRKGGMEKLEEVKMEQQTAADPRKNRYVVDIRRDKAMMMKYIKFYNRVKHPRVTFNLVMTGILLALVPTLVKNMALPGVIVCYGVGALLVATGLFRQYLALGTMRGDPAVKENEELTYLFGNTGVRVRQNGSVDNMGYYKTIYRIWEDEKTYYVGMNEDDLLILPKANFTEGEERDFKEFILEKSGADYRWLPVGLWNRFKNFGMQIRGHITRMRIEAQEREKERRSEKGSAWDDHAEPFFLVRLAEHVS